MAERPEGSAAEGDNRPKLSLHVPEPKFRPGDTVDFSHINIPDAGSMASPDETCDPGEMRDMAFGLVRVLGEDNQALKFGTVLPHQACGVDIKLDICLVAGIKEYGTTNSSRVCRG